MSRENEACQDGQTFPLSKPDGYISSHITWDSGAGSTLCPWRLEAEQGQVVNVTLINFLHNNDLTTGHNYG